ncbi:O-antigen ligase family protein [Vibrio scophthalmi]|uniref:O-antigen ligase-related domain-containing protein n=1 Tax=Vibrio scophthalmi TaxID=45658 RepID=A0A1E3WJM0_9VIBR|nr:O-antigen ligase family protein [Vibrio scophthalmi]ODS09925.1 hypothetical protein VSF3289_00163 [Vibrio scophthalmi]
MTIKYHLMTEKVSTFLCAFFFLGLLITPDSYKLSSIPIALISLVGLYKTRTAWKNKPIAIIGVSLISYFLISALSLAIYGGDISQLDMPSRVIIAGCILAYIVSYPPSARGVFLGISISAIVSSSIALVQMYSNGGRALDGIGYMIIQAGGIASSLCVLSTVALLYAKANKDKPLILLAMIGFISALTLTFLSGVRGAWVLTPFIIVALLLRYQYLFSKRSKCLGVIAVLFIAVLSYPAVKPRVVRVVSDISNYTNDNARTSIGGRLDMWKSAFYSAQEKPIFGQGFDGIRPAKERQIEQGLVDKVVLTHNRAHNQFLEELQTKGLIGFTVLACFFGLPLWLLWKRWTRLSMDDDRHFFALAGMTHITAIVGYCLTQHYLAHHSGILLYSIGMAIFAGAAFSKQPLKQVEDL